MPWKELEQKVGYTKKPYVILYLGRIRFNAALILQANLTTFTHVNIFVDDEKRRIGFLFHKDDKYGDAFKFTYTNKYKNVVTFCVQALYNKYAWVRDAIKDQPLKNRRFVPYKENDLWCIDI